ncbi:hypothetical protein UYO_2065 [Lachnospiraceae bacterium JC7]|nr:hypothetical protein UYO_2065 [Lachnospiraceae bacterium JC7]
MAAGSGDYVMLIFLPVQNILILTMFLQNGGHYD